jgi:hypothetical protein
MQLGQERRRLSTGTGIMDLIYMMLHVCIHLLDCTFALELLSHVRTYTGAIFFFLLPLNSHE